MRYKKTISMALALVVLLLSLLAFQMFQKTQLIMFDSISLNMPVESVEKVFGKPNEIVESGRVTFTFSKSHRLQGASVYFPVASKAQQKEIFYQMTQDMKAEIEALLTFSL